MRRDKGAHAVETGFQSFGRDRLDQIGKCPVRESMLLFLFEGNDLDGNMPGPRIELQIIQHGPAQHIRKEDVERDAGREIFKGQFQGLLAPLRHQAFETFVPR